MKCPICSADLSPLDLVSRTEHVDLCIEHGPAVVEVNDTGQLVVKKTVAAAKRRLICPICDKTFMNLATHFKSCALKYDVPPQLMLTHWDQINSHAKIPKKFPRDLLDSFVEKCIKEGRVGDQVDFARALSLSMAEEDDDDSQQSATGANRGRQRPGNSSVIPQQTTNGVANLQQRLQQSGETNETESASNASAATNASSSSAAINANQVMMQNAASGKPRKRYRLELVGEELKASNIALRIDRELAASRSKRYQGTLRDARNIREQLRDEGQPDNIQPSREGNDEEDDDDDCVILLDTQYFSKVSAICNNTSDELSKLFHRARLKDCNGSDACLEASCTAHELELLLEDFRVYSGSSMDAPPKTCPPTKASLSSSSSSGPEATPVAPSVEGTTDALASQSMEDAGGEQVTKTSRPEDGGPSGVLAHDSASNGCKVGATNDDDRRNDDWIIHRKKGNEEVTLRCQSQP